MPINALVIGLGQIGVGYDLALPSDTHVQTHVRAMATHPTFRLLGGVDPDATRRALLEQAYGVPAWARLADVHTDPNPDVVIVATSTESHCDVVDAVLHYMRPRAILCEKPLAYDAESARWMADACEQQRVELFVNYMRRADPGVIEIKRRIASHEIVPAYKAVVWYSKGFLHSASHFLDLATNWFGDIQTIACIAPGQASSPVDWEPDIRVSFPEASVTFLAVPHEAFTHHTMEVVAWNGRLRYERGGEVIEWQSTEPHPRVRGYNALSASIEHIPSGMDRFQWHVADQLVAAIDRKDHHLCRGRHAVTMLEQIQLLQDRK